MSELNTECLIKKGLRKNLFKHSNVIDHGDDEIVKLERQFRNAYMLKSLEAQIAEKEANKISQSIQDKLQMDLIDYDNKKFIEKECKKKIKIKNQQEEYVGYLRKQIAVRKEVLKSEEEMAREERKILIEVDKIVDDMHEFEKIKKRHLLADKLRREKLIMEEIKEVINARRQEEEAELDKKNNLYLHERKLREEMDKITRDYEKKLRDSWVEKVSELLVIDMEKKKEKYEREDIICELIAEDIKYELIVKENENKLLMREGKKIYGRDLMDQMLESIELEEAARKRDEILTEKVIKRVMEEDNLSRLTAQARKRKQLQYKEDLVKFIEDARRIRKEILAKARAEFELESWIENEITSIKIEDQRRRLIDRHAKNVAAYLKNGIIREIK